MNTDNVWIVIVLLVVILLGANGLMFLLARGWGGTSFNLFKNWGDQGKNPWQKQEKDLDELSSRVRALRRRQDEEEED